MKTPQQGVGRIANPSYFLPLPHLKTEEPNEEQLPVVVNPKTLEEFVLIRKKRFEALPKWIAPLKSRWDKTDDDHLTKPS